MTLSFPGTTPSDPDSGDVNNVTVWGSMTADGTGGIVIPSQFGDNFAAWFNSLPLIDPLVVGKFWNNGGTLAESSGP